MAPRNGPNYQSVTRARAYLLRLAHGAHRLRVVSDVSAVPRADAADGRSTDEAVETARLVDMVRAAGVRRPTSSLQLSPSVAHRRQLVILAQRLLRMSAGVAQVQLAFDAHPRRRPAQRSFFPSKTGRFMRFTFQQKHVFRFCFSRMVSKEIVF